MARPKVNRDKLKEILEEAGIEGEQLEAALQVNEGENKPKAPRGHGATSINTSPLSEL